MRGLLLVVVTALAGDADVLERGGGSTGTARGGAVETPARLIDCRRYRLSAMLYPYCLSSLLCSRGSNTSVSEEAGECNGGGENGAQWRPSHLVKLSLNGLRDVIFHTIEW
jgi:hypothetical protein